MRSSGRSDRSGGVIGAASAPVVADCPASWAALFAGFPLRPFLALRPACLGIFPLDFFPPPAPGAPGMPGMPGMPPPLPICFIIFCASPKRSMSELTSLT